MKILVTGNLGFIGSHLTEALIECGEKVIGIDDLSGGSLANQTPGVIQYLYDCRDFDGIEDIFKIHKPEIVYHLAANAAENKAQFSPMDITSRNFGGSINVLTAAIQNGVKNFIFTSSIAVYGGLQTPFKVTDTPEPEDLYGITKLSFEKCLEVMAKVHDFEYVITRPHNVYGPRQNMRDPYRNVVTIWMNAILNNKPYHIYGDGEQRRQFTYIKDVIRDLVQASNIQALYMKSGTIINSGTNSHYSLNALSRILREVTGTSIKPEYLPNREQEVKEALAVNYESGTPVELREGLEETWEWCKKMGPSEPVYTELEIDSKKIPKNWRKND